MQNVVCTIKIFLLFIVKSKDDMRTTLLNPQLLALLLVTVEPEHHDMPVFFEKLFRDPTVDKRLIVEIFSLACHIPELCVRLFPALLAQWMDSPAYGFSNHLFFSTLTILFLHKQISDTAGLRHLRGGPIQKDLFRSTISSTRCYSDCTCSKLITNDF